jgi:hypothetical protein
MRVLKSHVRLTTVVLSFVFTHAVFAGEPAIDVNEDNSASNTTGTVTPGNEISNDVTPAIEAKTQTVVSEQQPEQTQTMTDAQSYRQEMDERRRQMQEAQLETYKRHLERRKQHFANRPAPAYDNQGYANNVPAHIQQRRDEFIKQMEERRAMNVKMMEQNRKEAEERRKALQLKMHQTCAPESVQKA